MKTTVHELKIMKAYFEAVVEGRKTFEIRKDDRGFKAGHEVVLKEIDATGECTGLETGPFVIGHVTRFEQKEGYVVFSLLPKTYDPFNASRILAHGRKMEKNVLVITDRDVSESSEFKNESDSPIPEFLFLGFVLLYSLFWLWIIYG